MSLRARFAIIAAQLGRASIRHAAAGGIARRPTGLTSSENHEGSVTIGNRIGIGHDTHRLIPGGPLRLGGIDIPHDAQLLGHSDADVLLHAVTDALLGAIGAGDIGDLFPDTLSVHRGRDSAEMLRLAYQHVRQAGYHVQNLDCIVFAQRPKLGAYKRRIAQRIAEILEISADVVGLKAKTGEEVGPIGREEAISAQCVVLLGRNGATARDGATEIPP